MFEHTKNIDIHSNKHSASKQVISRSLCFNTDIHIHSSSFKIKFFKCIISWSM